MREKQGGCAGKAGVNGAGGSRHVPFRRSRDKDPSLDALRLLVVRNRHHPRRERAAHLLELRPGRHLLGEQRGLDAVEQALQPADQLGLRDPQLGLAGQLVLGERQRQPFELADQLGREPVFEFLDGALVNLFQPGSALLVQGGRPDLFQQLPDHAADPHDLGWLLDHLGDRALTALFRRVPRRRYAVRAHHEDLRVLVAFQGYSFP